MECTIPRRGKDACPRNPDPEAVKGEEETKAARGKEGWGQRQDQERQEEKEGWPKMDAGPTSRR